MADEDKSLDDFFAKKDKGKKGKSKAKGKTKFTTSSSITKQVENSQKPVSEQTKEQKPTSSQFSKTQNEDEWEDFNEPKEKDYSGLKVQSFQTMDKMDENEDEKTDNTEEGDEDSAENKDKSSGVWQVASQPAAAAPVQEAKEEPKKETGKPGAYIPPSRRGLASQASSNDQSWKYSRRDRIDPRRPPEIGSEIAFPTLQASTASSKSEASSSMNFESVRNGGRAVSEQSLNRRTNIAVDNKFSALSK